MTQPLDPLKLLPRCRAKKYLRRKRCLQRKVLVCVAGTHQRERIARCFVPRWGEDLHIHAGVRVPRTLRCFVAEYEAGQRKALAQVLEQMQRGTP